MRKLGSIGWGYAATALVLLLLGGLVGAGYHASGAPLRHDLELCDNAIRETLIAPTTYKRVAAPDLYHAERRNYRIEFDADNGLGVPIRGKGFCALSADRTSASWVAMP